MFCCLFKVSDTCSILAVIKNSVKSVIKHQALILVKTDSFKNLRKWIFKENCLLFFSCVIRNIDYCKSRKKWCTYLILIISCGDRIYAWSWDKTFHIIISESKIIKECKEYIRRVGIAIAWSSLIKLVDNEYKVRFTSHIKCFHDNTRFCIGVYSWTSCKLFCVIDWTHIKRCPWHFKNLGNKVGNLWFACSGRTNKKDTICRKSVCSVNLNNCLNDSLFNTFHTKKLFVKNSSCFHRVNWFEVIALPLNIKHDRKCSLCMSFLFRSYLTWTGNNKIASCP